MRAVHAALRVTLEIWFRFLVPLGGALTGFLLLTWAVLGFRDVEADHSVPIQVAVGSVTLLALSIAWLVMANMKRFRHSWRSLDYNEDDSDVQQALREVREHTRKR